MYLPEDRRGLVPAMGTETGKSQLDWACICLIYVGTTFSSFGPEPMPASPGIHPSPSEALPHWRYLLGRMHLRVSTADYASALELVTAISEVAEAQQHHPEIDLRWGLVHVAVSSHDAGGITDADVRFGRAVSQLVADRGLELQPAELTEVEIGPCVWTQHSVFSFGGFDFDQHEHIHVAWCDPIDLGGLRPAGLEALEALAFGDARWWGLDDLLGSAERTLPHRLREFLPDLVEGRIPDQPRDITHYGGWD